MAMDKLDFLDDFKAECGEHIAHLNEALLKWEKNPGEKALQDFIYREFHNIKAASRMMGFKHIEALGHELESVFVAFQSGKIPFHSKINDVFFLTFDQLDLYLKALPDMPKTNSATELIGYLQLLFEGRFDEVEVSHQKKKNLPLSVGIETKPTSDPEEKMPMAPSFSPSSSEGTSLLSEEDGTLRVRVDRLDNVLNRIEELVLSTIRFEAVAHQFQSFEESLEEVEQQKLSSLGLEKISQLQALASKTHSDFEEVLEFLKKSIGSTREGVMELRMIPLRKLFSIIPRLVRDLEKSEEKEVDLTMEGGDIEVDRTILEKLKDPIIHIVRNCFSHGLESPEEREGLGKSRRGQIKISARRESDSILIDIEDDGRGIDLEIIREQAVKRGILLGENASREDLLSLLFSAGFSTSQNADVLSGRGVGLDVVKESLIHLKGTIHVLSEIKKKTVFSIRVPLKIATSQVLLVRVGKETYAIPIYSLREIVQFDPEMVDMVEDQQTIYLREKIIPIVDLRDILGMARQGGEMEGVIVLSNVEGRMIGFGTQKILGNQQVVIKSLGSQVRKLPNIQGATILGGGEVVLILNPEELIQFAENRSKNGVSHPQPSSTTEKEKIKILVVDDSITTRRLEEAILKTAGYDVETAVNGREGLFKLEQNHYDIAVVDIEMPLMNGWELTEKIRKSKKLKNLPIIIVSSLDKDDEKRKSLELGANGHISKGEFHQEVLTSLIEKLVKGKEKI